MATAGVHPIARVLSPDDDASPATFMQLFGEICASPIAQRVGVADEGGECLHVWVRLGLDDEDQEEAIYRSLQAYRATGQGVPVDLHVVLAAQPDGVFPSDAHLLFVRRPSIRSRPGQAGR
jgi:hypothetical protein